MADVKWIKVVTSIFDDEKILLIESMPEADSIIVIWFKLLCLAGKNNNSGVFTLNSQIAYSDEMLATIFRRNINTVRLAIQTFERFGMIEIIDGVFTIPNWGKHQNFEQIESRNEYMKNYMRDYRSKQKLLAECKPNSKSNVSALDKKEKENKKENKKESNIVFYPLEEFSFSPPVEIKIRDWLTYKSEKKETYKPVGFKSLMATIQKNIERYGEQSVIDLIDECMANNWKGIIWERIKNGSTNKTKSFLDA